jgi:hypothetical protein
MRTIAFLIVSVCIFCQVCHSQLPTDGHFEGNSYVNTYFHVAYSWPKFLHAVDAKSLALSQLAPNGYEFLLFAAKQGDEPFGAIVLAEKLNVPTMHTSGIKDGADFLDRAIRSFDPVGKPQILSRKHFTNSDGISFDQLDYLIYGEYSSGIAARFGNYLIVFKFNAKSAPDLGEMTRSAVALRRTEH